MLIFFGIYSKLTITLALNFIIYNIIYNKYFKDSPYAASDYRLVFQVCALVLVWHLQIS